MPTPLFYISKMYDQVSRINSYMVTSSATINIEGDGDTEDELKSIGIKPFQKNQDGILEIASKLVSMENPELIIAVHGYNTGRKEVKDWFESISNFINTDAWISKDNNKLFIGYRWPSEKIGADESGNFWKKSMDGYKAMPIILRGILGFGVTGLISSIFLIYIFKLLWLAVPIIIFTIISSLIITLVLLRTIVYFRDNFRANNYGVPDLVELIRQIDKLVIETSSEKAWENKKIKLSFVGHSMGGFVVTNTVRILSDVFDTKSIGELNQENKQPDSDIGHVFTLQRLILASPDIPVDSLVQGRANYLSSSLRRFKEAYLFSNEGDLALRLASTAANYFTYPAKTRNNGYRLGNLVVEAKQYGIINLEQINNLANKMESSDVKDSENSISRMEKNSLDKIVIGYPKKEMQSLNELQKKLETVGDANHTRQVASLFTFIDCTDYKDLTNNPKKLGQNIGVLSFALRKEGLNLLDYFLLTIGYVFQGKDVHGGYFSGETSKTMLYRLAFIGFQDYLHSVAVEECKKEMEKRNETCKIGLQSLSELTKQKGIQIILSPERYVVDVLDKKLSRNF
jgi:hypothetical protein